MAHAFFICMTCCLFLPCNVLQICGFFSPYWMQDSFYRGCFRGVLYNVGCPDDCAGLGFSVLGLQVAAFFFMILSTAVTIYSFFCSKDDANDDYSCCDIYVHLFVCFYPIAGIIGIIGCIIAMDSYGANGWGLYLCLVASSYIILQLCCTPLYED
ncbi:uncharacterized protein LOC128183059 [Crassostrea angulata]|uniref:uncharacterized protein LOC128183059 n=1 Tax=Magallana angulata TaxID=2784310 RepID=UPI0022B10FF6|nr:uncharacterized protein LOC128183059 [Crassostrea angulata]